MLGSGRKEDGCKGHGRKRHGRKGGGRKGGEGRQTPLAALIRPERPRTA